MDLTIFEIHLDGAQFGPTSIGGEPEDEGTRVEVGEELSEAEESGGVPRAAFVLVPVFVALGVAAGYLAMRRLRGGEPELEDAETVEIEA